METQRFEAIHVDDGEGNARVVVRAPQTFGRTAFLLLFAALVVNAAIVLVGLPNVSRSLTLTYSMNFGDLYDLIARNLDQGNGYRVDANMGLTMLREPGYPLVLAVVFKLLGYGIQTARATCVLLTFGAALILLRLARKITGDSTIALTGALIFLLYPGVLVAETRAGIEPPFIFAVLLFMLALYSALEKGSLWRYGAAGLLLGVAVLVRSQALLFPLLLLVYLLVMSKNNSERVKIVLRIAVLGLGALIVMSPWIIRNYELVQTYTYGHSCGGRSAGGALYL